MTSHILKHYRTTVVPALQKQFGITNVMAVPRITKITINTGIGRMNKDDKAIDKARRDLALLSGQKAVDRKAKKSVSSFKVREGMVVGLSVTLRGARMYDFIDRLVNIALPASKDFRGIDPKNVDSAGNLNLGIREHGIFPEISYETLKDIFGLQITVTTTARTRERGLALLTLMRFPFRT